MVTRRTGVFPQLQMVKFDCLKCGHLLGPYYQNTEAEIRVNSCPQCQGKNCFQVWLWHAAAILASDRSSETH